MLLGVRLLYLSITRKPKVRHTFMAGPRDPRLFEEQKTVVR